MSPVHTIRRIQHRDQTEAVVKLAQAEKHLVLEPSHLLQKHLEIVGYCSMGSIPLLHVFFSQKCDARDSVKFIAEAETHMRALGQNHYFITCTDESPFAAVMPKLGFKPLFPTRLYSKEI
jgi:hypothetical protein